MTDLRSAAEFARHDDQRGFQQAPLVQIVEQGREGAIRWRKELVAQVGKRLAVRVPRLVVPQVNLHEGHAGFHEAAGHQ